MEISPVRILIADDNPYDVELMIDALRKCDVGSAVDVAGDGAEALKFLRSSDRPQQLLVLLDINMPKKNGFEVLKAMKDDPNLRSIPVTILTTSSSETDIVRSYAGGACSFVTKPLEFEDLVQITETFSRYWGQVAKVPKVPD